MRLKDVLALPKDVNSLPLLKNYLNQPLDYHDHMAAFLHYINILFDVNSYDVLTQEAKKVLQRYLNKEYDDSLDQLMSHLIDTYLELEQLSDAHTYIQERLKRLPVLKKHEVYKQMLIYKQKMRQEPMSWLVSIIDEDMPNHSFQILSETLLHLQIDNQLFDEALVLHEKMSEKLSNAYVLEHCQILDGLNRYDALIDLLKPILDDYISPELVFYLIKAYIKTNQNQRAINLEVEHETLLEQASESIRLSYYQMMLKLYESIDNSLSVKVYKAQINKLLSKSKKQKQHTTIQSKKENKRSVHVTLESPRRAGHIEDIEKLHDWYTYLLDKTAVDSKRDELRLDLIKLNQLTPFQTVVMYQTYDHQLLYFKKERLYDKKIKQNELDQTFLKEMLNDVREGFIEPHMYNHYKDIITMKPFLDVQQLYVYRSQDLIMMFYFNEFATQYAQYDDILRIFSRQMMLNLRHQLSRQKDKSLSDMFQKLMNHPQLVVRVYREGVCEYSKAAKRWFKLSDDEPIELFIKQLHEHQRESYKASFRALYNYDEPSKVFEYTYLHRKIKEFAVVHKYRDQPLILSVFYDETSHTKQIEHVKQDAKKDIVTGLLNLHAFYDDLPNLLQDKLTILKIKVNKQIAFLYGQKSYMSYFKEFGFLTKKLIDQSQVYMFDGNHFIVTVPYNDIRAVNVMLKKYFDALRTWTSKSIPQELFSPKIGIIRYPVVTSEKHVETLMHYLDIALSRVHDQSSFYYFKYQDYEKDQFEQHILDQMLDAIEHQQFSIGFNQIIDQKANRVWMYESFAYIPHLDVDAYDIMLIAVKRKRIIDYDMAHIEEVLNMLHAMYEKTKKYINILIPVNIETFTHHMFSSHVSKLMKAYNIPSKIIDFNIVGDMKASVYHQLMNDIKAIGIGIHTSSLKVSLYYDVDALHFDIKKPDEKMLDYLSTIQAFASRQGMTFVLRGIASKEVKSMLAKAGLNVIEGRIYKQMTKEALISKVDGK